MSHLVKSSKGAALLKCHLFAATALLLSMHLSGQGFLKAQGKLITDGNGKKVILRGMGLGGWMLQEGYMFRLGNIGQQYRIREKIEEVVGAAKADLFYDAWLANHTTKTDIDSMGAWGFNSIRLPMHYNLYTLPVDKEPVKGQNTWLEKGFVMTDSLLGWCRENKMYLILDLHAAPGGQGHDLPISDRDESKPSLWESEENRQKTIALWRKLAERYANEQWMGGYDIINEPNWSFTDTTDKRGISEKNNEPLRKLMMDITKAIREVDKNHIIIIEGNGFGNNYNGVLPAWDSNMVLSFHKYGNFNTNGAIKNFLDLREKYNLPLWLGESGENFNTWFTEAIALAESHDIGWAWWQQKKMGINNPLEIIAPDGYEKLLDYWSGKAGRPSEAESWKILEELLQNLRIAKNIFHNDVIDAMFRQVGTTGTKPFRYFRLEDRLEIPATDFDLGRQGYAYYDRDTANYRYTAGVNTTGNRGRTYRNDGVDIKRDDTGPYVFYIEDGEWMQYTIDVARNGYYNIIFNVAYDSTEGRISFFEGDTPLIEGLPTPAAAGNGWQKTTSKKIYLRRGVNRLRVISDEGGFRLKSIELIKSN